jgi:hypothetical protein
LTRVFGTADNLSINFLESVFVHKNYRVQHDDWGTTVIRKPGNSGWSSGRPATAPAASPTEFELQARRLGLTEDGYASSDQLRRWCEHNRDRCYIPEWLLKRWGIPVDPNVA